MWTWIIVLSLIALAGLAAYVVLRSVTSGQSVGSMLFGAKPEKRLGVTELTPVDSRRRLVLVRRDDVEHLIMIGGPVDLVIEANIGAVPVASAHRIRSLNGAGNGVANGAAPAPAANAETPTFGRAPRRLGEASTND